MLERILPDGTKVCVQWSNPDPNHGGQHTNGGAPAWVSLNGGKWLRSCCLEGRYTYKVRDIIELARNEQELSEALSLQDQG